MPMKNFTERRDKDRAVVPPTSLAAPATMDPAAPDVERCRRVGPRHHVTVALAITLDAVACPPTLSPSPSLCRRRQCPFRRPPPSPTLVAVTITITLFVTITIARPPPLSPTPSLLPPLSLPLRHPPPSSPSPSPLPPSPLTSSPPASLITITITHVVAVAVAIALAANRLPPSLPSPLAAKAITLFVALHPRRQRHHPLYPPRPLRHPPPLSPSPLPCHPHPFRHMPPSLVDCFFTFIVGWAVSQQVSQHAMI